MCEIDDDELRRELDEFARPANRPDGDPAQQRVISGFEEILHFISANGEIPHHGADRDIFERIYAVRLDRLRRVDSFRELLTPLDTQGLLQLPADDLSLDESIDDDELLAELANVAPGATDLTTIRHVRPRSEASAPDEIANREPCRDFDRFQPLLEQAERELADGLRQSARFARNASIDAGDFFILGGVLTYVAEVGDPIQTSTGRPDARLRVIYANGTESNLLMRSLQRALYKDEAGRRLGEPNQGPLFSGERGDDDRPTGTLYVLRSQSDHNYIVEHRELIHKIGVTGGSVDQRIAGADRQATYLLADVEVVATYELVGINRSAMERLIHRIFAPAQIDITINDRFGNPFRPREWFLVPLHVIREAVDRIRDGSITTVSHYDPAQAALILDEE